MSLTLDQLKTDFGNYYKAGSQSQRDLLLKLYRPSKFDELFTTVTTDDTIIRQVRVTSGGVLQAYQDGFTPNANVGFQPVSIDLYKVKLDAQETFDQLEQSYIGFLASNSVNRTEWPISRWYMEQVLLPQFTEDIELNAFIAAYVAPTPGQAGTPAQSFNGFRFHVRQQVTAGNLTPIATGAPSTTANTWVDQVEAFVETIPDHIRTRPGLVVAMAPALALRFKKGMRIKYNQSYLQEADLLKIANFPNITISEQPSMAGSEKIFATFKTNLVLGIKKPGTSYGLEGQDRVVKFWHDHYRGYGIADTRLFWTNDRDNA